MNQNNIPKNIDDVIDYMEINYGIKLFSYQKEMLKMMWKKEYYENLLLPRGLNTNYSILMEYLKIILYKQENNKNE